MCLGVWYCHDRKCPTQKVPRACCNLELNIDGVEQTSSVTSVFPCPLPFRIVLPAVLSKIIAAKLSCFTALASPVSRCMDEEKSHLDDDGRDSIHCGGNTCSVATTRRKPPSPAPIIAFRKRQSPLGGNTDRAVYRSSSRRKPDCWATLLEPCNSPSIASLPRVRHINPISMADAADAIATMHDRMPLPKYVLPPRKGGEECDEKQLLRILESVGSKT